MASGLCVPHKQAAHMAAPTEGQSIKNTLANGEPSTHGAKRTLPFATVWEVVARQRLNLGSLSCERSPLENGPGCPEPSLQACNALAVPTVESTTAMEAPTAKASAVPATTEAKPDHRTTHIGRAITAVAGVVVGAIYEHARAWGSIYPQILCVLCGSSNYLLDSIDI